LIGRTSLRAGTDGPPPETYIAVAPDWADRSASASLWTSAVGAKTNDEETGAAPGKTAVREGLSATG